MTIATKYEPELGQMAFGQPWKSYAPSEDLECALCALSETFGALFPDEPNPFANTGGSYSNSTFSVEAYSWDDDYDQKWNLKYGDLEVSWYKHAGRGVSCNVEPSHYNAQRFLVECLESLNQDYREANNV